MEPITILHLNDGTLFEQTHIYDLTTVVVKGLLSPKEHSQFISDIQRVYRAKGDKMNAEKESKRILKEMGRETVDVLIMKVDFSEFPGDFR